MKPSASAPASTATRASSALVIPQILTRVISALASPLPSPSARAAFQLEVPSALASPLPSPSARAAFQLEVPSALASPGIYSALASWLRPSARIATPAELSQLSLRGVAAQLEERAPSQLEVPSALASPGSSPAARRPRLSSKFH